MPTNVPPPYRKAEARYRQAVTTEEKLSALEEMLRLMPKHKGTDKLQADIKARISKLKRAPKGKAGASSHSFKIPREGAGQVALVGPPNGGKSSLVDRLTHASPKVADYPFTTMEPVPGMMPFEDVAVQLVDLPPISTEHVEPWVYDQIRRADIIWMVVESSGSLDGLEMILTLLDEKHIELLPVGTEPPDEFNLGRVFTPALLVITGRDRPGSEENVEILDELMEEPWPRAFVSAVSGEGLDELAERTFRALDVIRVYTKEPHKPPDRERPFTLPRGSTVEDLARTIHRDILENLKFAKMWGASVFDGQPVQRDHVLEEGDVVEIHV